MKSFLKGVMLLLIELLLLLIAVTITAAPPPLPTTPPLLAKRGCPDKCGNITIPFPFGTQEGCYIGGGGFKITCNETTNKASYGVLELLDIFLNGTLRVLTWSAFDCYNKSGMKVFKNNPWIRIGKFKLSSRNKFVAVGCDTIATVKGSSGHGYATGCLSMCNTLDSVVNGSCSGIGCCETSIPKGVRDFNISVNSYDNHTYVNDFNLCSHAFVVEDGQYNFSSLDLAKFRNGARGVGTFPTIFDWSIGNKACKEAKKNRADYACLDGNSECRDSENGSGYLCFCAAGYQGNPYLPNGCKDIDECLNPEHNNCTSTENCRNTIGNYTCVCPKGQHGDGRKAGVGQGCMANKSVWTNVIVGVSTGFSALLVIISFIYFGIRRRNIQKRKEKFFRDNGGLMLQQLLSKLERSTEKARIFTEDELKKATNDFNSKEIIGQGGYGTVYKGTVGKMQVAIKKSKVVDYSQTEQFLNEMMVLSQINHPNVVKLIGFCLETPVPLLVYEFITNKTLHHHIHEREHGSSSMPWDKRLRIAEETAGALAHMHSDAPIHIIHRDVKSANILLDDDFTAKVSDFGVSRLIPLDQTQLSTLVQGTFGYIDPEYFHSGLLNEKSDVYSFGVVLVELLTGEKVLSPDRPDKDKSLASYFINSVKEDRLLEILDERVKIEGQREQVMGVAELAKRCLRLTGAKRPTMKEVKEELEEIRRGSFFHGEVASSTEETEPLLGPELITISDTGASIELHSLPKHAISRLAGGR